MLPNNQALNIQLINTAQQFRLGKEAEASKRLRACIDLLESELKKNKGYISHFQHNSTNVSSSRTSGLAWTSRLSGI